MNPKDWDRVSDDYYYEILSPIKDSDDNPLFEDIKRLSDELFAIDLGCGLGDLIPHLKNKFKTILGVDYSPRMIEKAKKRYPDASFEKADLLNLKKYKDSYDVAVAINSIISTDTKEINKILDNIYGILRLNGYFFAVLPSMEVYLHQAMLVFENQIRQGLSEKKARSAAAKVISDKSHDLVKGTITFDGDTQKCYYRFEIIQRLERAGFREISVKKVKYSWKVFRRAGQEYFPGAKRPWDWYVSCRKS